MKHPRKLTNKGFTIVEMLIATAVFSMVLLLCAVAIVRIGQIFYKGVTINRTQDSARRVIDDIVQAIQFGVVSNNFYQTSGPTVINGVNVRSLCLGDVRYSYVTDRSLGSGSAQARHVMWKDRIGGVSACTPQDLTLATPSSGGQEMLGDNMRLPTLTVTQPAVSGNTWSISIVVSYGDTADLFVGGSNFGQCVGDNTSGQFCAVSAISTNVVKRL